MFAYGINDFSHARRIRSSRHRNNLFVEENVCQPWLFVFELYLASIADSEVTIHTVPGNDFHMKRLQAVYI